MCSGRKPDESETASVTDQCPPPKPACEPGVVQVASHAEGNFFGRDIDFYGIGTTESGKSVWFVRNPTTTARNIEIIDVGRDWSTTFTIPAHTDVYVMSGLGNVAHRGYSSFLSSGAKSLIGLRYASGTPYEKCQ